jgi:hypothetical protein
MARHTQEAIHVWFGRREYLGIVPPLRTAPRQLADAGRECDWPFVLLAIVLGALIGYAHLHFGEIAVSALLVAITTMILGACRPRTPWLWALLVALCVPAAQLIAYLGREHFTRGATFGSFALLAPAFVCSYGGAVGRRLVAELFNQPG